MAAPKAPSELGQSWPELITAAVLLFVPPPQDGALLARYIKSGIYRITYIVHLYVPLYGSTIFFSLLEKFPPVWIESTPRSFATALPYTVISTISPLLLPLLFFLLIYAEQLFFLPAGLRER